MLVSDLKKALPIFGIAFTCVNVSSVYAQDEMRPLEVTPAPPALGSEMTFLLTFRCSDEPEGYEGYLVGGGLSVNGALVNLEDMEVKLSYSVGATDPDSLSCSENYSAYEIPFSGVSEPGKYRFNMYSESVAMFDPENLANSFDLYVLDEATDFWQEVPSEGSIQSGIGLVRGWACNAEKIEVKFNDEPRQVVAYGTSRTDTRPLCGDNNNGYGKVLAWGALGIGSHTMKTYIDGEEVSAVDFEVGGLDEPFVKGLSGNYTLDDFPQNGQAVTIEWSEGDQNFIILEQIP